MSSLLQTTFRSTSQLLLNVFKVPKINSKSVLHLKMSSSSNVESILRSVFLRGVNAVRATAIFKSKCFEVSHIKTNQNIVIKVSSVEGSAGKSSTEICIDASKRCHLVGIGKAVLGLAAELERVLNGRLVSGILSVPFGTGQKFSEIVLPSKIEVLEGARNNLPDAKAEKTAQKVKSFVESLGHEDVLFVLITGGGSALLPLPSAGVSLAEKCYIIKQLAARGASINDINTVRIDLSDIKGGKLAAAAVNAHQVIGLIVSDIIRNPIELIASGPTVVAQVSATGNAAQDVLERFGLWPSLEAHIRDTIYASEIAHRKNSSFIPANVKNFIIASNESAVDAALTEARAHGLATVCISNEIDGLVSDLSEAYTSLASAILNYRASRISRSSFQAELERWHHLLHFREGFMNSIDDICQNSHGFSNGICLIGGGEPTVRITGQGLGGRNQELALRFSINCFRNDILQDVVLLSAGTDGIDGPTTAAGAIGRAAVVSEFLEKGEDARNGTIEDFVLNNDSFNFYQSLDEGKYHVVTGHTGTNVMDLHVLYIPLKAPFVHKL